VRCVSLDPNHVQANVRLAQHLLLRSTQAQNANERDRLLKQSSALATRAAFLAPTHSEPILIVAEGEIARNGDVSQQEERFRYSLRLRPVDGRVLARLALIELLAGNVAASDTCWQAALERDPARLASTIKMLRVFQPPAEILRRYQPGLAPAEELLRQIAGSDDRQATSDVLRYVALKYADAADNDSRDTIAEQHFSTAYQYASQTYDDGFVISILERRIARNPLVIDAQFLLAEHLVRIGATERIDEVLNQCTKLSPGDDRIAQLRVRAGKIALRSRLERPLER